MNYNDDNRIRRKKVSSNDYNYKSKQHQRYYEEKVRLDNVGYENKIENNKIKRDNINKSSRAKKRKKAKKKMRFKLLNVFLSILLIASIGISAIGSLVVISSLKDTKVINKEILRESYISSEVVPDMEIPKYLKEALVSIEDERFYEHQGVDIISLTRSVLHNIFSDTIQGGSTIEMQISKNLLTSEDKTITRKIKDMYYATQMDKFMTKDEILCTYLNNVYFGKSAYGVGKASKVYFGKDVQDLTLAQSAMLVGITNSPAKYKEHREAKKRQEVILYKMKELGYIDEDEYIQAINEDVPFKSEIE
ncbi:MAG TPA: transglycosylase domain-containing protein [Romboutsia timonensis]|uniref:Penicillin-binding protein 1A n=1 Tax=Romboutsia timonensis TaxID=1776391 RepID=A0A921SYR4_9FIRM|nr:biosynthetic peptidoglycan transglycosylase [uncultured Romboutsia sp.]HJG95712.1 transglycosylase domain-containing protein [Romboutsia timonensis]